jgi:hypothetical protein
LEIVGEKKPIPESGTPITVNRAVHCMTLIRLATKHVKELGHDSKFIPIQEVMLDERWVSFLVLSIPEIRLAFLGVLYTVRRMAFGDALLILLRLNISLLLMSVFVFFFSVYRIRIL